MDKQEKLQRIYEVIARKDLSFGCRIIQHPHVKKTSYYLGEEDDEDSCMGSMFFHVYDIWKEQPFGQSPHTYSDDFRGGNENNRIQKIIGHPVMIGDVLDWYYKKYNSYNYEHIISCLIHKPLRKEKRKPIEEQSDDTISFVYDLITLPND